MFTVFLVNNKAEKERVIGSFSALTGEGYKIGVHTKGEGLVGLRYLYHRPNIVICDYTIDNDFEERWHTEVAMRLGDSKTLYITRGIEWNN